MHELISIEKSKLLPIAAAMVVLAAGNWANTTKQYLFELNHDVETMPAVSSDERAGWTELDRAAYQIARSNAFYSHRHLVGPPNELTALPVSRLILNLPQSATEGDVTGLIMIRLTSFNATGCNDSKQEALAVLGLSQPVDTKILLARLHILDRVLFSFGVDPRYGQFNGMVYRISHFKLLNEMREKAIARGALIDDLTFGLL